MDLTTYRSSPSEQERTKDILKIFPAGRRSILDVGARDGHFSAILAERFCPVTALDLVKPEFEYPGVTAVQGDVTRLQFPDNSFDVVFCAEVLEHIPPALLARACSELARVARHEVIVGVPYAQDLRVGRMTCVWCGTANPPWGHLNSFDAPRLSSLFAPLEPVSTTFVGQGGERTTALAAFFMDLGRNPWGTYNQEEPCEKCGKPLVRPENRPVYRRLCSALAYCINRCRPQRKSAMWIHMVFRKA